MVPASLGKNNLFSLVAAVVALADHTPEVEPSPGSAPGGGRGARREGGAGKPPLSAVTAALRVRLGIASDFQLARRENIRSA